MRSSTVFTVTAVVILALLWTSEPLPCADIRIVAILSHDSAPYEEVLEEFRLGILRKSATAQINVFRISGDLARAASAIEDSRRKGPSMYLTLGSLATQETCRRVSDVPIVAGMIMSGDEFRGIKNLSGVTMEFPLETHFQWLKRILPQTVNVGVIYNPAENGAKVETARKAAREVGLSLDSMEAYTPQDIPAALDRLARRAQAMWGITDRMVLTPQTAEYLLLFSLRNRIPFIGLSSSWVKAGALYSLDWDYADMGAQCAEIALKIMEKTGNTANSIVCPRKVAYTLNLRTAREMKIEIPKEIIDGAREVF